jgi:V/A-type H+-transporting ATPase subunit D
MSDIVPTHSAFLELQEERRGMQDGYRFLDEKRLVLAGELLAALKRYEQDKQTFDQRYQAALNTLRDALERHGLGELQVYPALELPQARLEQGQRRVLGVELIEAELSLGETHSKPAVFASAETQACQQCFQQLMGEAAALAAQVASLQRLWFEYRRTSRRARALEDVLLPEIKQNLSIIDAGLEEQDREEAIRVRHFKQLLER